MAPGGVPPGGLGLGGLLQSLGIRSPLALGLGAAMKPTPAETGEWQGGSGPGHKPSGPQQQQQTVNQYEWDYQHMPADEFRKKYGGDPPEKTVKDADGKTKKVKVHPKTGKQLPTKVPTKKEGPKTETGHYEPATGEARDKQWVQDGAAPPSGYGPMMQDVHGVNLGLPRGLGHLAQAALPLMLMAAMAGFGGKRNRGHYIPGGRGFGGMGHPGGRGPWPYHHPTYGWQAHNFHPGGDWRPGNPRAFAYPNFNTSMNPWAAYALGQATGPQQNQQQQQGQPGQQGQGPYGPGNHFGPPGGGGQGNPYQTGGPQQGPWSQNPVLSTIVGQESGGSNDGAPGQPAGGDGGIARGYWNIQTPTWHDFAPTVPGASQYATADAAPPEVQTQVAMNIPISRFGDATRALLHRRFGDFPESLTVGELAAQNGQLPQFASNRPGSTPTGGVTTPNPQGNPAEVPNNWAGA